MYFVSKPNTDAFNFLDAAGITRTDNNSAIIKGIADLTTDLKSYGIWDKMKAIYPMVGQSGVSSSFEVNLKDPSTFRGTFYGTWSFANTGATPDGATGYMDTNVNPSINLTNNNNHISIYSRTNTNGGLIDLGVSADAPYIPLHGVYLRYLDNFVSRAYSYIADFGVPNIDTRGFFVTNRTSNTVLNSWKNGSKQGTASYTSTDNITTVNRNYFLGAINLGGVADQFSDREYVFASIGDGLTDTEAANFYTAVQRFQTTLGRQV